MATASSAEITMRGDARPDACALMAKRNLQMMAQTREHARRGCAHRRVETATPKPPISTPTERRLKVDARRVGSRNWGTVSEKDRKKVRHRQTPPFAPYQVAACKETLRLGSGTRSCNWKQLSHRLLNWPHSLSMRRQI
jgi:hypothetical protein